MHTFIRLTDVYTHSFFFLLLFVLKPNDRRHCWEPEMSVGRLPPEFEARCGSFFTQLDLDPVQSDVFLPTQLVGHAGVKTT